ALLHANDAVAVLIASTRGEVAGERGDRRASRWILDRPDPRREHPRMKIVRALHDLLAEHERRRRPAAPKGRVELAEIEPTSPDRVEVPHRHERKRIPGGPRLRRPGVKSEVARCKPDRGGHRVATMLR